MPPKKKTNKVVEEQPVGNVGEKVPKIQEKVPAVAEEVKKDEVKPEAVKSNIVEQVQLSAIQNNSQNGSTNNAQVQQKILKLPEVIPGNVKTEGDLIEERRKKFGVANTMISQQSEHIRKQRLKKFGGSGVQDEQTILKRKQKFSSSAADVAEDEDTIKRRRQKFGNVGAADDKETLQARKLKFTAPQVVLSLDDEIQKSKGIHKFHKKFNNHKRHAFKNRHQGYRGNQ